MAWDRGPVWGGETIVLHVTFATRTHGPLQELTERRERLTIEAYPLGRR